MHFDILGEITDVETITAGPSLRQLGRLQKMYGKRRWRKKDVFRREGRRPFYSILVDRFNWSDVLLERSR